MINSKRFDSKRIKLRKGESQRENGSYDYRWTTRDGKRHSVYAKTLDELREKEKQIIVDDINGMKTDVAHVTVNDLFKLWCDLKRGIKDNTLQNYKYMYNLFVTQGFGKLRVTMVKRTDVKRFYNNLTDGKTLKISTLDTIHNILHQVFDMAVDDNYIRQNPTDRMLKELKQSHNFEQEKRKALTTEEQKIFLEFLKRTPQYRHWYPVFAVMLGTGMRVGETTGLRWCDVDMDKGIIDINHTLVYYSRNDGKGCTFAINTPKTKSGERQIPMMDFVKEALMLEKQYQNEAEIKCRAKIDCYTDFIFINRFGDTQHQGTLNKALNRIIRDCNDEILLKEDEKPILLPKFSCHTLRHTFTTRMCESGVNIKVIQEVLGHKDISTTMNIYADATKSMKQREMELLQNKVESFTPNLTPTGAIFINSYKYLYEKGVY